MKHLAIPFTVWIILSILPEEGWSQRYRAYGNAPQDTYSPASRSRNAPLEQDRKEIRLFEQSLTAYEQALNRRDGRNAQIIRMDLESDMRREIRQNENKLYAGRRNVPNARTRTSRRPDGSYSGTQAAREQIVKAQESVFFNFSRTQVRGKGRAYGQYRKSVSYLYDFLDTMREDVRISRSELGNSSYQTGRNRSW